MCFLQVTGNKNGGKYHEKDVNTIFAGFFRCLLQLEHFARQNLPEEKTT